MNIINMGKFRPQSFFTERKYTEKFYKGEIFTICQTLLKSDNIEGRNTVNCEP